MLCAVQKNLHAARKVLSGIIGNVPKNNKPKTIIFDLRFLSAIKQKVFLGSEKPLFVKHTAMMREACEELPQSVEYVPLACEAHSHRSVALAKTVAAPIMATGVGSALMYATSSGPYYAQSLSGSPDIEMIKNRMAQLFTQLDASVRNKYRPAFDKWNELVDKLNHERNTVPFACLTTILATAINETPEGDTNVAVVMGCKSAKDRTISIVLGNSMLQTLFEKRLADDGEIENLVDQQGYFNCDSLTAEELMMLKDLFDIRVLHVSNKFNVGFQGNINTDVLQDSFFKNVDFIHESSSYTVGMGV
ncbi:TPA: transposase [Escherichia coli]|uniref:transposase n=1 Tax=Escherichia coli TaxID=562 RepID=UPI00199CF9B5|nr:transposase [Escherichia coli]HAO0390945.1 transposase [Escherichia coli]